MILSPGAARAVLLNATGFARSFADSRELLDSLGCVQLDPLDRIGTNADLVAFARMPGARLGDVYRDTAGYGFEHFAKERCIIAPRFFPHYREQAVETPWWRNSERMKKLDEGLLADVLAEVRERGPLTTRALTDRGRVEPMDWGGWKSTTSRAALAAEVLWTRCALVVSGREGRAERRYDLPERVLGAWALARAHGDFHAEMVVERVRSAGLLSHNAGPHWSMLANARVDGTIARLVEAGRLLSVRLADRRYLMLPDAVQAEVTVSPTVIGPLDALIWDRALVRDAFGFDYVWEVYKPAGKRVWGYYVVPVLSGDGLVGRLEAVRGPGGLTVLNRWGEVPEAAIERLRGQNGVTPNRTPRDKPPP